MLTQTTLTCESRRGAGREEGELCGQWRNQGERWRGNKFNVVYAWGYERINTLKRKVMLPAIHDFEVRDYLFKKMHMWRQKWLEMSIIHP